MSNKTSNVHLVIVTGQTQANLIPILQFKPEVIALAVSQGMKNNADQFVELLKNTAHYQDENIIRFDDVPAMNLPDIEKKALAIYQALKEKFPNETITYHATGGTGIMVLGFYKVFSEYQQLIIYTDTTHGQIEIVLPTQQPAISIEPVLDMKTYLRSLGEQYEPDNDSEWEETAKQRQEMTLWLGKNSQALGGFFSNVNGMAMKALSDFDQGQANSQQYFSQKPYTKIWIDTLEKLAAHNICDWSKEHPTRIVFNNADLARYLSGIWLEEYVWLTASALNISEVTANVEFTELVNDDVRNEADCIAVHNNRLLIIECKTVFFKKGGIKNSDILYKLNTLSSRAGGLYGDKWLVSVYPLDEFAQSRAEAYRIKIIAGNQLKNLKTELEKWRDAKR